MDPELYSEFKERALKKLKRYFSYRPRTVYETRRYLQNKFDQDQLEEFIETLINELLITGEQYSDLEFINWWVESRNEFRPRGKRALVFELKLKGIPEKAIQEYFESHGSDVVPEKELALRLITKYAPFYNLADYQSKSKLFQKLARKGFSFDIIKNAFEEFIKKK